MMQPRGRFELRTGLSAAERAVRTLKPDREPDMMPETLC